MHPVLVPEGKPSGGRTPLSAGSARDTLATSSLNPSREWNRLRAGTLVALGTRGVQTILALAISVLLARLLGDAALGSWYLTLQIAASGALIASAGTQTALQRFLPACTSFQSRRRLLRHTLLLCGIGLSATAGILSLVWDRLSLAWLDVPAMQALLPLALWMIAGQMVEELGSVFFRATGRARLGLLLLNLPRQALLAMGLATLWWWQGEARLEEALGLRGLAATVVAIVSVALILRLTQFHRPPSGGDIAARGEQAPGFRELAATSFPMLAHSLSLTLIAATDLVFLSLWWSQGDVGIYGTILQLAALLGTLMTMVNLVMPPMLAEMHRSRRLAEMEELLRRAATVAFGLALIPLSAYLLLGRQFLDLAYPAGFERGYWPLLILASGQVFNVFAGSPGWLLQMCGQQKAVLRITLASLVFKVLIGAAVVPFAGLSGAAWTAFGAMVLQNMLLMRHARKHVGVRCHARWPWRAWMEALRK